MEFVTARIAEDEDVAKRAAFGWGGEWSAAERSVFGPTDAEDDWSVVHADGKLDMVQSEDGDVCGHIARWDPARVLAEIEAKRRIVLAYIQCPSDMEERDDGLSGAVSALASAWSTHPDYDPGWLARWPS